MVRSLVLAEPPIHQWAKDSPAGAALYWEFLTRIWEPAAAAFKAGDDPGAMRILVDGFAGAGSFAGFPPQTRTAVMQNSRFFKAATASADPFPALSQAQVRRLNKPVLVITGEHTIKIHKFINEELMRLLPKAERTTIPRAGHGSARENSQAFNEAALKFLADHR
jgi:pimeloyl-ACP methyl ester carboxylesterase